MTKFQWFLPKLVLLLCFIVVAGAFTSCSSGSLATGVERKSPHQDETSGNKTAYRAPFTFMR